MTSRPFAFSGFIRGVTTAFTVSSPRADETFTMSPDFTPSFSPSDFGISIVGSGTSSLSHGMLRVVEPAHQCSATVDVMRTYGKSATLPIGWCDFTRGYFSIGLWGTFGWRTFSTGVSTGSYISGSGPSFGTYATSRGYPGCVGSGSL